MRRMLDLSDIRFYFRKSLDLLEKRDRIIVWILISLAFALTILDVIGLLVIAGMVSILTWTVQGIGLQGLLVDFLEATRLDTLTPESLVVLFGISATLILVLKSISSFYLNYRQLKFLADREAQISENLARDIFDQDLEGIKSSSSYEYQNAINLGSAAVTSGLISQVTTLVSEFFLQIIVVITLFVLSPWIALFTVIYFGTLSIVLVYFLGRKARKIGEEITNLNINTSQILFAGIQNFRFVFASRRQRAISVEIGRRRRALAKHLVSQSMLNVWSKYAFEVAIVIAVLIYSAIAFILYPAAKAVSLIVVFLVAAYRIAPSLLKIQNSLVQIRGSIGSARNFFNVRDRVFSHRREESRYIQEKNGRLWTNSKTQNSLFYLDDVTFNYTNSESKALKNITLNINIGDRVGIVGDSGAGKSTLIDLLLGLIQPSSGTLSFRGEVLSQNSPIDTLIGYVPQDVFLLDDTIKNNLLLFNDNKDFTDSELKQSLSKAGILDWVDSLPLGMDTMVGELGGRISGGQRQRLGIARALLLNSEVLIFDEATSSLDGKSERHISDFLLSLDRSYTILTIAHRLSTVRNLDYLIHLKDGEIIATGTFDELVKIDPAFRMQVKALGLEEE